MRLVTIFKVRLVTIFEGASEAPDAGVCPFGDDYHSAGSRVGFRRTMADVAHGKLATDARGGPRQGHGVDAHTALVEASASPRCGAYLLPPLRGTRKRPEGNRRKLAGVGTL